MKIINHNNGNYHYCDGNSGSVMYGSIYITMAEWFEAMYAIKERYEKVKKEGETYTRDMLQHAINYNIKIANAHELKRFSIGVEATKVVFDHFKLPRYKKQNYSINII